MKERNILWRYFTAVNENIANSDVCRKEILCCGSKRKKKKKEDRGADPLAQVRGHWQSPSKGSKNIPLVYTVVKMTFQSWHMSDVQ